MQWRYYVVSINFLGKRDVDLMNELNEVGSHGWELVAIIGDDALKQAIFKGAMPDASPVTSLGEP
jgi:hypothetical protein